MTTSNLSGPSYNINQDSTTPDFFNNFFNKNYNISPNANDAVVAYFEQIAENKEAAAALAAAVIYTSLSQEVDPMATLDEFRRMPPGELNVFIAMYLNLNRVGSSALGVRNAPLTNKYVNRTIIP
jgi:hypothetical protein